MITWIQQQMSYDNLNTKQMRYDNLNTRTNDLDKKIWLQHWMSLENWNTTENLRLFSTMSLSKNLVYKHST